MAPEELKKKEAKEYRKAYRRAYYLRNREKELKDAAIYYQKNKEDKKAYDRAYYLQKKERLAANKH